MKKILRNIAIAVILIVTLGIVGNCDRVDSIKYERSDEVYMAIKSKGYNTDEEIANEYMSNKDHYDRMSEINMW